MSRKKRVTESELATFIREYARKRPKGGGEPNDRSYDRRLEAMIKRMRPEELDALLRDDGPSEDDKAE